MHVVFLNGAYHEDGAELVWNELGHLQTRAVGQVLEDAVRHMMRPLRRHGLFELEHGVDKDNEPEAALCASAVSGREPPAGPQADRTAPCEAATAREGGRRACSETQAGRLPGGRRPAPSFCAARWRSMSSSARPARAG
ncbi:hypothetical protein [Sorangium sp. So ce1504]|uniref:hypothetical protein n=1 Tax=unclassified Sorangium TaxID=2621164 RepID=UPI003F629877